MKEYIQSRWQQLVDEGWPSEKAYYRAAVEWVLRKLKNGK